MLITKRQGYLDYMNKAFFLDRDGVINVDHGYVSSPEQFEFIADVFDACKEIQNAGYKIVIITNQSGIGRGYYTESQFNVLTTWMVGEFEANKIEVAGVYFCPHHPEKGLGEYLKKCDCRKPEPGMLLQAAEELNIDCSESFMIGDKPSDIEVGNNAGVKHSVLVSTGKPIKEDNTAPVYSSLQQAVSALLISK